MILKGILEPWYEENVVRLLEDLLRSLAVVYVPILGAVWSSLRLLLPR